MIDTAGTMVAAAEQLMKHGAEEVHAACTHAVLSGPAVDRIKNSSIGRLICTNTLPLPPEKQFEKLEGRSLAPIPAQALHAVLADTSVSKPLGGRTQPQTTPP